LLRFNAEGHEGGFYHSRVLHAPGPWSGLTLGRGYDMKEKSAGKIIRELTQVGVSTKDAQKISKGHGLKGERARQFIIDNDLLDFSITPLQQKKLFLISYEEKEEYIGEVYARNIASRKKATKWSKLDARIKEVVVDLGYRGDYTSKTRKFLLDSIAANDFKAFKKEMSKRANWSKVPIDRFNQRKKLLN